MTTLLEGFLFFMSSAEVVSGSGRLGASVSSERVCLNVPFIVGDASYFERLVPRFFEANRFGSDKILPVDVVPIEERRHLVRSIASSAAVRTILEPGHPLAQFVESAMPLPLQVGQTEADRAYYIQLAQNGAERARRNGVDRLSSSERSNTIPFGFSALEDARAKRYTFVDFMGGREIFPEQQQQLLLLWGDSFKWSAEQVADLSQRLSRQNRQSVPDT
ncbi:MAG: hypothetical protein ACREGI_00995, partial [Candidatus Levyibacteriota bacterium]